MLWVFAILVGLGAMGFAIPRYLHRRTIKNLSTRPSLSEAEIYSEYYASSGVSQREFAELWHEVAGALAVPPELLRPGDQFGKDVGSSWIVSDELDELARIGRARAKRLGLHVDLSRVKTVDDYIRLFV